MCENLVFLWEDIIVAISDRLANKEVLPISKKYE